MRLTTAGGRPLAAAGLLLGIGLGGFVDGIVAHQLLEWHHMLSGWYPMDGARQARINMVGDGLFHPWPDGDQPHTGKWAWQAYSPELTLTMATAIVR